MPRRAVSHSGRERDPSRPQGRFSSSSLLRVALGCQALAMSAMRFLDLRSRSLGSPTLSRFNGGRSLRTTAVSTSSRKTPSGLTQVARNSRCSIQALRRASPASSIAKLALPSGLAKLRGTGTRSSSSDRRAARLRRTVDEPVFPSRKVGPDIAAVQALFRLPDIQRLGRRKPELAEGPTKRVHRRKTRRAPPFSQRTPPRPCDDAVRRPGPPVHRQRRTQRSCLIFTHRRGHGRARHDIRQLSPSAAQPLPNDGGAQPDGPQIPHRRFATVVGASNKQPYAARSGRSCGFAHCADLLASVPAGSTGPGEESHRGRLS